MSTGEVKEKNLSPRDRLVQSGIAQRMIDSLKIKGGLVGAEKEIDPSINFGIDECDFSVRQIKFDTGKKDKDGKMIFENHTQVVIEMPNPNPKDAKNSPRVSQAFGVEEGGSFGKYSDAPLTPEQYAVIREILSEQEIVNNANQEPSNRVDSPERKGVRDEVLEAVENGAVFHYAPLSGDLILLQKGEEAEVQPTIEEFIELRKEGKIKLSGTMSQGHAIFHGRVDMYKKSK